MVEKLKKTAEGTWKWNLIEGEKYPLWAHYFWQMFDDSEEGTYIGKINGYHVFVEIKDNRTYSYNTTSDQAIWIGEPDEGPYSSYVDVYGDGEVRDEKIKRFIATRLEDILKPKQLKLEFSPKE